jgi:hypothetical protein
MRVALAIAIRLHLCSQNSISRKILSMKWISELVVDSVLERSSDTVSIAAYDWAATCPLRVADEMHLPAEVFRRICVYDAFRELHQPKASVQAPGAKSSSAVRHGSNSSMIAGATSGEVLLSPDHFRSAAHPDLWLYHLISWPLIRSHSSGPAALVREAEQAWVRNVTPANHPGFSRRSGQASARLRVSFDHASPILSEQDIQARFLSYRQLVCGAAMQRSRDSHER